MIKEIIKLHFKEEGITVKEPMLINVTKIESITPPDNPRRPGRFAMCYAGKTIYVSNECFEELHQGWINATEPKIHIKDNSEAKGTTDNSITIVEQDGLKWVRVKIYGEDFMLCTKDFVGEDGKNEFEWQEAVDETEKHGWTMPDKKQWDLIDAYRKQIDKLIEKADGDSLDGLFWSVARSTSVTAWFYYGISGRLNGNYLSDTSSVRPLAYFKKS